MIVTRFAPSPTGLLHLGHAYAAITAYESGDDFLLRIEDIDKGRSRDKFIQAIFYDLKWLGLSWDEPSLRQSTRMGAYAEALVTSEPKIEELISLYAMISRMRVLAFPRTVECAEKTMREVMDTYNAPNRTMLELHELIKSGEAAIDPLKEFSEAAREELRAFTSR